MAKSNPVKETQENFHPVLPTPVDAKHTAWVMGVTAPSDIALALEQIFQEASAARGGYLITNRHMHVMLAIIAKLNEEKRKETFRQKRDRERRA